MDQVEEVKHKTDIVQIISEHVQLKKAGRNYKGVCPFHSEKTPSFMVSPELQIYKCFGCSAGGDVFHFLMEFEAIDFPQALKLLAERAGVKLVPLRGFSGHEEKEELFRLNFLVSEFFHYILTSHPLGEKALNYLKNRGIGDKAIDVFKLGYSPDRSDTSYRFLTVKKGYKAELLEKAGLVVKGQNGYFDRFRGRIIFPLSDHFGNVVGFAGRVIEDRGDMAKYVNSPETLVYKKSNHLYGLSVNKQEIKREGRAVVVEGEFDCISSWQAGVGNVVAIKGSALTEEQARLISRFCSSITLGLDSDFAGDQASRRGLEIIQKAGLEARVADLGQFKDPDEMARQDKEGWINSVAQARGVYDFIIDSVCARFDIKTTEGKARISQNLIPVLASIDDEIVKAHCVKKVSERLDVSEDAVTRQIEKKATAGTSLATKEPAAEKTTMRRELVEKHFLSLAFYLDPSLLFNTEIKGLITTEIYRRLIEEAEKWGAGKKQQTFDLHGFGESLPLELMEACAAVVLDEAQEQGVDELKKEIEHTKKELKIMDVRQKMADLSKKIKDSEKEGKTEEVEVLELQLTQTASILSTLGG